MTCESGVAPSDQPCGHTAEDYALTQLALQPVGRFWSQDKASTKAAIFRAAGGVFAQVEQLVCDWLAQVLPCNAGYLTLPLFEAEFDTINDCVSPDSEVERQARVCAASRGGNLTLEELQAVIRDLMDCDTIVLILTGQVLNIAGVRQSDIGSIDNYYGLLHYDGSVYKTQDPAYADAGCSIIYDSYYGDGGLHYDGTGYVMGDPYYYDLLVCTANKYVPSHIEITYSE